MRKPSILCERLPATITVDGVIIPIKCDFRRWILFVERMTEDDGGISKLMDAVKIVCPEHSLPDDPAERASHLEELITQLGWFALCGEEVSQSDEHDSDNHSSELAGVPVFDFEFDAARIIASFMQAYGIDLTEVSMHWWKFMALLRSLPPDSEFMRVVRLRRTDTAGIEDDALRRRIRRAKAAVRIRK